MQEHTLVYLYARGGPRGIRTPDPLAIKHYLRASFSLLEPSGKNLNVNLFYVNLNLTLDPLVAYVSTGDLV